MRQQHVVHCRGCRAHVAQTGRVMAEEVGQPAHTPRLIDRRDREHAVADPAHDDLGVVGKPFGNVRVPPAAKVCQWHRQFPVIERGARFQPAFQHGVGQTVVEIQTLGVWRATAFGHHAGPAC